MFYCICVSHRFIRPSDDGQFGCFHVLAIFRQATLKVRVCVFQFRVFSTYKPKNEIAVSCLCSNFVFLKESGCCAPQCLFQFTFPLFLTLTPAFTVIEFFDDGESDQFGMITAIVVLLCISVKINDDDLFMCWSIFSCA